MKSGRRFVLVAVGVLILVAGLVAATFVLVGDEPGGGLVAYDFADGKAFAVDAAESKAYRHEIERFGGKAALLADDLNRWLASWRHGRRLALLIVAVALVAAGLCFRAARRPPPRRQ